MSYTDFDNVAVSVEIRIIGHAQLSNTLSWSLIIYSLSLIFDIQLIFSKRNEKILNYFKKLRRV